MPCLLGFRSAAMHALPRLSEALEADVHVTLCMYDVMRLVKDLRLWVSRYRNQAEKGTKFRDALGGCG